METPENVSWVALVLAIAIVVGLFIAYQTTISARELEEDIYVRILRSEYLPASPFLLGRDGIYSSGPYQISSGSYLNSPNGGYAIDLRIGNLGSSPIVEIRFKTIGFGRGEVYLITGENVTSGYHLDDPLNPKESLELSIFIPSDYVPSGKILVVEGTLESGKVVSKSVKVP